MRAAIKAMNAQMTVGLIFMCLNSNLPPLLCSSLGPTSISLFALCLLVYLFAVDRRRQALHAASLLDREHTALAPGLGSKSSSKQPAAKSDSVLASMLHDASSRFFA